jgi:hypothetical protein
MLCAESSHTGRSASTRPVIDIDYEIVNERRR